MPKLVFSSRFVDDMKKVTSKKLEARILADLKNLELFADYGNNNLPTSIKNMFGENVRVVAVTPFDLIYRYYPDTDETHVEALVYQRGCA
jgi:hypothetical protein